METLEVSGSLNSRPVLFESSRFRGPCSTRFWRLETPEAKQVGIYLLVGDDHDADYPSVYIGQTGSVGQPRRHGPVLLRRPSRTQRLQGAQRCSAQHGPKQQEAG